MMTGNEIRKKFLEFFATKDHRIVASDSLVPKYDPTVLFTTAGMQQFKRQFLGQIDDFTRAASSQKCLRTDDLDQVGKTAFHHTFFEMLGNFSFGDYFKKEAIAWAWEFLTGELKIHPDKLWVSIYKDDEETEKIWLSDIKIPGEHLVKLGDKSNFWPSNAKTMGPNGPCGPCSEIFFDYGPQPNCPNKEKCNPDCDCGRFSEIWNLVFTQYNRKDGGVLEPLPGKNIDTGMGLERLTAVIQGQKNNFDTDLFKPIMSAIQTKIQTGQIQIDLSEQRIIADHIRAIVFAINDGVIPSNKERGFVIRRLINDSTNIVLSHGGKEPSIYKLVPAVIEAMRVPYPDIAEKAGQIADLIEKTEEAFIRVRQQRLPELKEELLQIKNPQKRGDIYFKFRDTFGLPLSTIIETATQIGISETENQEILKFYNELMIQQKDRSRSSSKMAGDVFTDMELDLNVGKTEFLGYQSLESTATILKIFRDNQSIKEAVKGDVVKILLNRSPFYAEAGGQVGDTGILQTSQGACRITDTQKTADIYIHFGEVEEGFLRVNETVTCKVDQDRRLSIMRNHTATHILQSALRSILGSHVQQQGSLVAEDRLRFDFTHPKGITPAQMAEIENYVNSAVLACDPVSKNVMPIEEAKKSGALAFFAEKYGSTVRVVSINGYSKEFCGGTHLDSTGQIGLFKITSESAIAQGIRRIEAKTGFGALRFMGEKEQLLEKIAQVLKVPPQETVERIKDQSKKLKQLERELEQYQLTSIKSSIPSIIQSAQDINAVKLITHKFENIEINLLRQIKDLIKQQTNGSPCTIVLGTENKNNSYLLVAISDELIKKGLDANDIVQQVSPLFDGSGGGRAQMAQAGSKRAAPINEVIKQASEIIKKKMTSN